MIKTIPDIITSFKKRDKTALIYKTGFRTFKLSYKKLYENVLKTCSFLEKSNIKRGDKILLWGFNSPQWGTVFLSCALKGIIVVPIDYMATSDFVEKIQSIVGSKAIFHSEFKIPPSNIASYIIEYLDNYIKNLKLSKVKDKIGEKDILEIVYTSGTTGDPKGVIITHKNLITNISSVLKAVNVESSQGFLSLLPLSHLFEQNIGFLAPLYKGCSVVYIKALRPSLIFKALKEEKITNIIVVPRLLKLFRDGILREVEEQKKTKLFNFFLRLNVSKSIKKIFLNKVHRKFGKNFLYFLAGGAPLSRDIETFWNQLGFTLIQGYGLTECSPVLTANTLGKQVVGSVGKPIHGIKLKFAKDGEILASGESITSGYYLNDDETSKMFDKGWLRTGDVGYLENGYVFLKDRKKDVIVTSAGMNVYPQDIEKVLLVNKEIKDACILGLPTSDGEHVHAEIILKDKADLKKIIEESNKKLNESQQIISYKEWPHEDFPRTTTLKIKKRLVLEEILARQNDKHTQLQENKPKLYEIISKVCDISIDNIKPNSKLSIDLGLTSVNRIELVSILEQEFNLDINEDDITSKTTVNQLQDMVRHRKALFQKNIFRRWTLWAPFVTLRVLFNYLIADNGIRVFCKRTVIGKENLRNLKTPAIFIANHVGYFDGPNVLMSLPFGIRAKIAPAAWKEYFDVPRNQILNRILAWAYYQYASIFTNIYLFPKEKGFKKSLEYTGELLDKGWSILFFPEGKHSKSGSLEEFKSGIGWLVKEMKVPVVPIKHFGLENIMHGDHQKFPNFGKVVIKIGRPMDLDYTKSIPELTNQLHEALQEM